VKARPTFMKFVHVRVFLMMTMAAALACSTGAPSSVTEDRPRWGMVIHGGAGNFTLESISDRAQEMRTAMATALAAGHRILSAGGSSLDAVEAAVMVLEDSPQFNAGKGAVFTHEGTNELDAAIMDGRTRMAGAVAGVKRVKNPIQLARLVMEQSPHVLMVGDGAEAFAKERGGIEFVPESYFRTELRWQQLQRALEEERTKQGALLRPHDDPQQGAYFGTVGAVALDKAGNLAAATSTGGVTNKRFGRVGDSPIIGAGTYANNQSCAISATGIGEYFIRFSVAQDICARVEYRVTGAQQAADEVVQDVLKPAGGDGGVIGLDRFGRVVMSFNTTGMSRGYIGENGDAVIMFTTEDGAAILQK
jgi:beta-aspartyl-peptidase (threonine type)